jgi:hypothetical protein
VNWQRLLTLRNGLVHGTTSWPDVRGRVTRHPGPKPMSLLVVGRLRPGWAVNVATYRVKALHVAAGTPAPSWVTQAVGLATGASWGGAKGV